MRRSNRIIGFLAWLLICFAAAAVGATASINAGTFYAELTRPSWAPPTWLFGPVWTVLYTFMAIAAYLVWRDRGIDRGRGALGLFLIQLALNSLWTWLFFAWRLGSLSFAEIVVLWALIAATIVAFWRINRVAGALLVPYLLWVTFASVLNFAMWRLNTGTLV